MSKIDDRLAILKPSQRAALQRIRDIIHDITPDAEEVISYGMPGFKYKGKYLCGFDAFKDHLSFFPTSAVEVFKDRLAAFKTSKGTIQFTAASPIPDKLIDELVRYRIAAIDANGQ